MSSSNPSPVSIPRFIMGLNMPQPGASEEGQWLVHCHPPRYIAKVDIDQASGKIQLTPFFSDAQENFPASEITESLESGAAHYEAYLKHLGQ